MKILKFNRSSSGPTSNAKIIWHPTSLAGKTWGRHWVVVLCVAFISILSFAQQARSEDYPNRPITVIVGYAPGGGTDTLARLFADRLSVVLQQPVIVENRPGAGGVIGANYVAKSPPDGYRLLFIDNSLTISPYLIDTSYDPLQDFTPISIVLRSPLYFVTLKSSGLQTLQDLVDEAKRNPGKLSYGTGGVGTQHHLAFDVFKDRLELNMVHIPYKGGGPAVSSLLAGDLPVVVTSLPAVREWVKEGTVVLLASTSAVRSKVTPNVPAIDESTPGFDFTNELGFLAPAGTPPEVVQKLGAAIARVAQDPKLASQLQETFGGELVSVPPPQYAERLRADTELYKEAVAISGASK